MSPEQLLELRRQFPALSRQHNGRPVIYLDGPAGTQTPHCVIDAVSNYLANHNANHAGQFVVSRESDAILEQARQALAAMLNAEDHDCVFFGPNMTTLTMAFSRALSQSWSAGDEVVVTRLDHDANVTPWVLAARDAGAQVRYVEIRREDCTLDWESFQAQLSDKTRLVAPCAAVC